MSRANYSDDGDQWDLIRWRGAVKSAIGGKRGQQTLREILAALDAMPIKELVAESLVTADGAFCTLGALGAQRGIDLKSLDPKDSEGVSKAFGIADAMAREIVYWNDEGGPWSGETAAQRWSRMRAWVAYQIKADPAPRHKQPSGDVTGDSEVNNENTN